MKMYNTFYCTSKCYGYDGNNECMNYSNRKSICSTLRHRILKEATTTKCHKSPS